MKNVKTSKKSIKTSKFPKLTHQQASKITAGVKMGVVSDRCYECSN